MGLGRWRKTVMSQHRRPDGIFWVWEVGDDPEAEVWMVDKGNGLVGDGSHRPRFTEEVQSVIGVEFALEIEGQMQV